MKLKIINGLGCPENPWTPEQEPEYSRFIEKFSHPCILPTGELFQGDGEVEGELQYQYEPQDEGVLKWYECSKDFFDAINRGKLKGNRVTKNIETRQVWVIKPEAVKQPVINFTEFQVQLRCSLIIKDGFDNDWMKDFYDDYLEDFGIKRPVKEWAEDFFQDVHLDTHTYCLVSKAANPVKQPAMEIKPNFENTYGPGSATAAYAKYR